MNNEYVDRNVKYFKDKRTNFCFAYQAVRDGNAIALVPCTPEVIKMLENTP